MSIHSLIADRATITDAGAMFDCDGFSVAMIPSKHPEHGDHFALFYTTASFSSVSRVITPGSGISEMSFLLECAASGSEDARRTIGRIMGDTVQSITEKRGGAKTDCKDAAG
jgi:hypothetical protein